MKIAVSQEIPGTIMMLSKEIPGMTMMSFQEISETIMTAPRETLELTARQENPAIRVIRLMTMTHRVRMNPAFLPASR